jgi:hypothetical protein
MTWNLLLAKSACLLSKRLETPSTSPPAACDLFLGLGALVALGSCPTAVHPYYGHAQAHAQAAKGRNFGCKRR